jgi:hypothetical protein
VTTYELTLVNQSETALAAPYPAIHFLLASARVIPPLSSSLQRQTAIIRLRLRQLTGLPPAQTSRLAPSSMLLRSSKIFR